MAEDKKLSTLSSFDPMKDGQLLLVSEKKDGVWKSGKVSTDTIANYVMPTVLSKLHGADNISIDPITDVEGTVTGYQITHTLDTKLFEVCTDGRPVTGVSNKIYLVPDTDTTGENIYIEYAFANNKWEELGRRQASTDLSGYYNKTEIDTLKTSIESSITLIESKANDANDKADTNSAELTTLSGKVSKLETESSKHALQSDLNTLKTAQEKDAKDIVELNTKIGKHSVIASEGIEAVEGTGLLKELEDLEAGYTAADKSLDDRLTVAENTLKGVATTEGLATLRDTVTSHGTAISNLQTESASHATSTEVTEKVGVVDAKFANYVTTEVYEAHLTSVSETYETKTDITKKLTLKADKSALDSLTTKVTSLEDTAKTYQTGTQVQTAITTAIEGLATETYVDEAVAAADISGKLTDYLKTADAATTYATKTSVNDITKPDGTIDLKVKAAKDDLESQLATANETIEDLTSKLEALTAKLAKYDTRFGYDETTDTWSKSFLVIDE